MSTARDNMIAELRSENAALRAERDTALAREAALAEVLAVIDRSPGELTPVFDAILSKAHDLCGATKGTPTLIDDKGVHTAATRGLSQAYVDLTRGWRRDVPPNSPRAQLLRGAQFVQLDDIVALGSINAIWPAAVKLEGVRTVLFVPLRKDGRLLGYLTGYRQEVRPFTEMEVMRWPNPL